jgi:Fur family transcriptional regulator, zinc uptake regulator
MTPGHSHEHDHGGHDQHDHAPVFVAPDHDHSHCATSVVARAEALSVERGIRLTTIRRQVLEALAADHHPIGAYELIEKLEDGEGKRPAPITVYRALDFLVEQGFAHRIESRNAFIACAHDHSGGGVVMFLICESCGVVGEAESDTVGQALARAAVAIGFQPRRQVIEVAGICSHCRTTGSADVPADRR